MNFQTLSQIWLGVANEEARYYTTNNERNAALVGKKMGKVCVANKTAYSSMKSQVNNKN